MGMNKKTVSAGPAGFRNQKARIGSGRWLLLCLTGIALACGHQSEHRGAPEETTQSAQTAESPQNVPQNADAAESPDGERVAAGQRVYDRVLVRPVASLELDEDTLLQLIARQVDAPIERISKGPLQWRVIIFEALEPPRDGAAQKELVKTLRGLPELEKVEPDQIMFAR